MAWFYMHKGSLLCLIEHMLLELVPYDASNLALLYYGVHSALFVVSL